MTSPACRRTFASRPFGHLWAALNSRTVDPAPSLFTPFPRHVLDYRESGSSLDPFSLQVRHRSQTGTPLNGRRAFLVDTLQVVRRLQAQGLTTEQAEVLTAVMTEVLNDSLEHVAIGFASKAELTKGEMLMEASLSKFKGEVKSSQEHHFATLQRETERLRTDIDKIRSELRYEVDKATAGQRLDLNLEKGRMREELAKQNQEIHNLAGRLDRDIHTLRAQLEASKTDVIKYCIGTIVSVTAVGLGLLRILM